MKIVIALVAVVVGYGLFSFDWYGFAEWFAALSHDSRCVFCFVSYAVGAVVVWASSNIVFPDVDDEGLRILGSVFWLPIAVLFPVAHGLYRISELLKHIGRSLRK